MLATRFVSKCVFFTALTMVCLIGTAGAALAPPFAFEDRNDNEVFDGSDVDITQLLLEEYMFFTPHSVVIRGGSMKIASTNFKETGLSPGAFIYSGKNITVLSSILAPVYAGTVVLWADGSVRVGDTVTLQGRNMVAIYAGNELVIGNNVKILSSGGSANHGTATIDADGNVVVGSNFQMTTLTEATINSEDGGIDLGPGSKLTSSRGGVSVSAVTAIGADTAQLKGLWVSIFSPRGPISARSSRTVVAKGGFIEITTYTGTVDVREATFSVTPQIAGVTILR
jgi:hypothetical protein